AQPPGHAGERVVPAAQLVGGERVGDGGHDRRHQRLADGEDHGAAHDASDGESRRRGPGETGPGEDDPGKGEDARRERQRAGAAAPLQPADHEQLRDDDDGRVAREGEPKHAGRNTRDDPCERREPDLHLRVPEGDQHESEDEEPHEGPVTQHVQIPTRLGLGHDLGGGGDDAPADVRHAEQDDRWTQIAQRIDEVEQLEGAEARRIDEQPPYHAADADAEVQQREVQAKGPLPLGFVHKGGEDRGLRRPDRREGQRNQRERYEGTRRSRHEGERRGTQRGDHEERQHDTARTETIHQAAAERSEHQGHRAVSLVLAPLGGSLVDRLGARRVVLPLFVVAALGTASLAFVTGPASAFVSLTLVALAFSAIWAAQTTILASLVDESERQRTFGLNFTLLNLGIGVGGVVGGLLVDPSRLGTFQLLYLIDALSYLGPAVILLGMPHVGRRVVTPAAEVVTQSKAGGYLDVLRDRTFVRFFVFGLVLITFGYAQVEVGFTAFARVVAGVPAGVLGLAFACNTSVIVVSQLFVVRWLEGRSRTRALALAASIFALSWVILAGA